MPKGTGTYGKKRGRPSKNDPKKKKKPSRKDKIIARRSSKILSGKKKLKPRHVKKILKVLKNKKKK